MEPARTSSSGDSKVLPDPLMVEAEECITEVLGQITGEMIAELLSGESVLPNYMIGFTVQCTKVCMLEYLGEF